MITFKFLFLICLSGLFWMWIGSVFFPPKQDHPVDWREWDEDLWS